MSGYDPILGDVGYPCWDHRTEWTMSGTADVYRKELERVLDLHEAAEARALKAEAELERYRNPRTGGPVEWQRVELLDRALKAEAAAKWAEEVYKACCEDRRFERACRLKAEAALREIGYLFERRVFATDAQAIEWVTAFARSALVPRSHISPSDEHVTTGGPDADR